MTLTQEAYELLEQIHAEPCGERPVSRTDPAARELLSSGCIERVPGGSRTETDRRFPQVRLTSHGVDLLTTPTVTTYTTSPECYDGFGTRTVVPNAGRLCGAVRTVVRRVETPAAHVEWQRQRYLSGCTHLVADESQWRERIDHGLVTPSCNRYRVEIPSGDLRVIAISPENARSEVQRLTGETPTSVKLSPHPLAFEGGAK